MTASLRLHSFIGAAREAYYTPQSPIVMDQNNQIFVRPIVPTQEENNRTWTTFLDCVESELGANKVHEICRRYRFNPLKMKQHGLPLLPQHVELFSVGASRIATTDIKRRNQAHLQTMPIQQLSEQMRAINPFPIVGWSIDPCKITGDPTDFAARFVFDPVLMDKETQLLLSDAGTLSFSAWQERFCKAVVNRELFQKQIIPAPGIGGRVEYYKIHRRIATGDGLVAYALTPLGSDSTLKPLLVFRPTQGAVANEDAMETYLNDVQSNLGEMGYLAAKSKLDQLMQDPKFCPSSEQIEIAGYSLGGTHAQRFLADNWRKVSQATFYNDPSVESTLAERFAGEVNNAENGLKPLRLNIFRTKGDLVHLFGEKHLGWGVTRPSVTVELFECEPTAGHSSPELHRLRVLDGQDAQHVAVIRAPEELKTHLDNAKRGFLIFCCEKGRQALGGLIYALLYTIRALLRFFSVLLGIEILRSSKRSWKKENPAL